MKTECLKDLEYTVPDFDVPHDEPITIFDGEKARLL